VAAVRERHSGASSVGSSVGQLSQTNPVAGTTETLIFLAVEQRKRRGRL
jgi:hypothetical protein